MNDHELAHPEVNWFNGAFLDNRTVVEHGYVRIEGA